MEKRKMGKRGRRLLMKEEPDTSELEIAVILRDRAWEDDCPRAAALAERAVRAALAEAASALPRPLELAIVLTDDAEVRGLNRTYRDRDRATNVLSFPHEGGVLQASSAGQPYLLGDVVLARQTLVREAAQADRPLADHLSHLAVHGVLHLLGHDHQSEADAARMEALEVAVLASLGVGDPYRSADISEDDRVLAADR